MSKNIVLNIFYSFFILFIILYFIYIVIIDNKMSTKKAIIKYRKEHNLKQIEMAEMLNITQAHLSQLETGSRLPSKETTLKMIKIGVISDEIIFDSTKTVDLFVKKINKTIDEFRGFDLTISETLGALELVKFDLVDEFKREDREG